MSVYTHTHVLPALFFFGMQTCPSYDRAHHPSTPQTRIHTRQNRGAAYALHSSTLSRATTWAS